MNRVIKPPPGTVEDPRYPDSDGRFMGDTDYHNKALIQIREVLEDYFADRPDVYVTSNLVMYYRYGDPKARKDPDVLVAKGVQGNHQRRSYRFWEEHVVPQVLMEVASRRTWRNDLGEKRELYASLGVKEYFTFDPEGLYLRPTLQGFRTVRRTSVPMKARANGSFLSRELDLILHADAEVLRFFHRGTGEPLLSRQERADQLAAEVERLKRLLEERGG